jgi:tRNA 2-thiouridine synthesizing protein A
MGIGSFRETLSDLPQTGGKIMEGITITKECVDQQSFCWPPLMELIRSLKLAQTGDVLAIVAKDEESKEVLPLWVALAKEELVSIEEVGNATRFIVRKVH